MPGDPKECCAHAANCIRLAKEASTEEVRKTFFDRAQKWNVLAANLDGPKHSLTPQRATTFEVVGVVD
jgi:hypothetical protein